MKKIFTTILFLAVSLSAFASSRGIMLRDKNASLKKMNEKGNMEWAVAVPYGTELEILSDEPVVADYVYQGGSLKDRSFYKVYYQGKEYYALDYEIGIGDSFAVIKEDAVLFSNPKLSSFRNACLETGSIVVMTGNTATILSNTSLVEIRFYDTTSSVCRERWVLSDKVTTEKNAIKAAQLTQIALLRTDKVAQTEDIESALKKARGTDLEDYVQNIYNQINGLVEAEEEPTFEETYDFDEPYHVSIVTSDGSNIRVRSKPGLAGEVYDSVSSGTQAVVYSCTVDTQKLEGTEASWYYVVIQDEDLSGWVFGGFIDER